MNRQEQFQLIEAAKTEILKWAKAENIALFRVEYVVPFVEDDFSLSTWFFYDMGEMVKQYEKDVLLKRV